MESYAALGGTFDPVHSGHLQSAQELAQHMGYPHVYLVPCGDAYHKGGAQTPARQRLAMLELAIQQYPALQVDDRETHRKGATYTIDTLAQLREELGEQSHICWIMGTDTAAGVMHWKNWTRLFELANVLILKRPTDDVPDLHSWPAEQTDNIEQFKKQPCGHVYICQLTQLDISSSEIRKRLKNNQMVADHVPPSVLHYIDTHGLYRET